MERSSCTSETAPGMTSIPQESDVIPATEKRDSTVTIPNSSSLAVDQASTSRRPDVLRYVLPRPTNVPCDRGSASRVIKSERRRNTLSSIRRPKSRVTFHKVIHSLFTNNPTRQSPHLSRVNSTASSARSRAGSFQDSIHSVDVISPGNFLFSGPSLKSTYSESASNSRSRIPSLTETNSESGFLQVTAAELLAESFNLLDNAILEPAVEHGITRSMSDVLLGFDLPREDSNGSAFEDLGKERVPSQMVICQEVQARDIQRDATTSALLLPYLNASSCKALRSTCRTWHAALTLVSPTPISPSQAVPVEIIQHIYGYLGPKDFNAARHTCRTWMMASLNDHLLTTMLKRGGWWTSADRDLIRRHPQAKVAPLIVGTSDEWFLSRRLSRECALSACWTGNGLTGSRDSSAVVEATETDFSDLANGPFSTESREIPAIVCTVSSCGERLLVARDSLIYVYDLRGGSLRPLTSIPCPRRVVYMSMDATEGRNAVVALLEGELGMMCELRYGSNQGSENPLEIHVETHTYPDRTTTTAFVTTNRSNEDKVGFDIADRVVISQQPTATGFTSVNVQANYDAITLQGTDDHRMHDQNWINPTWNLTLRGRAARSKRWDSRTNAYLCATSIPIESGTSTFYRGVCTADDKPTSVSICPQRRCVAFGCSAGVELHWIDQRGQSLTRWFPLTAPSDFLYFLAPRPGFESANKLRLISSAAHPNERPKICRKFSSSRPSHSWSSFGADNNGSRLGPFSCDHYRAVPLSDGHHILFTEPSTNWVFLGCDAPLGGPTKLVRKILLKSPTEGQVPRLYAAATNLIWGARIVVVFGDTLVFYSVPPDVLALSRVEQTAESWDIYTTSPFVAEGRTRNHWLDWWDDAFKQPRADRSPPWPLAIAGTQIAILSNICELAVTTEPDITIWAFTRDHTARTWQLRSQTQPTNRIRQYICRGGAVHNMYDDTSDVIMVDPEEHCSYFDGCAAPTIERSVGFDGHSSELLVKRMPKALSIENDGWVELLDVRGCGAWFDTNGDVVMLDASSSDRS